MIAQIYLKITIHFLLEPSRWNTCQPGVRMLWWIQNGLGELQIIQIDRKIANWRIFKVVNVCLAVINLLFLFTKILHLIEKNVILKTANRLKFMFVRV